MEWYNYNQAAGVSQFCGFVECTCLSVSVWLTVGFENYCILAYAMYVLKLRFISSYYFHHYMYVYGNEYNYKDLFLGLLIVQLLSA